MLKNYLVIAARNFLRHKVHTLINLFGLTVGMVCTVFILLYVNYELSYDNFHLHKEHLYRVNKVSYQNGELIYKSAYTFSGQGPVMKNEIPEVADFMRLSHSEGVIHYSGARNEPFSSREKDMYYADASFFNLLSFRLLEGETQSALAKPNSIVLSESTAKKYFGLENPIGKTVHYSGEDFSVTGVVDDPPENSHLKFSALLSFSTLKISDRDSWTNHGYYTYVLLNENAVLDEVEPKLSAAFDKYLYTYFDRKNVTNIWNLQRVDRIYLYSTDFTSISMEHGNYKTVLYLFITALLVLIIAWVNFINHSIARLPDRGKEVGIRKTVGASQKQLIHQFVTESVLINLLAVGMSAAIVKSSLHWLNQFLGVTLSSFQIPGGWFWGAWIVIFFTGVLLTSMYPVLWLSSLSTTTLIQRKLTASSGGSFLRKVLIVFQFSISVALIIVTFVMREQISFTRNKDLGMNIANVQVVRVPGFADWESADRAFERFKQAAAACPGIRSVSASVSVPGGRFGNGTFGDIYKEGSAVRNNYFRVGRVDSNFIGLFGLKLLAGHNFNNESENQNTIIPNKEAVKALGFVEAKDAVDQLIRWNGRLIKIIGVVDNFHQESFHKTIEPMVLYDKAFDRHIQYLSLKLDRHDNGKKLAAVEKIYKEVFPGQPYDCFFLDDFFNKQYQADVKTGEIISAFASFAVLIAMLGLFNLMSYAAAKRTKEVGIRKVVGASTLDIVALLAGDFLKWVLLANVLAWPVAYYFMNKWLQDFAYRIDIHWWVFALSGGIALVIALATVSFQAIKAATANPVEALRYE